MSARDRAKTLLAVPDAGPAPGFAPMPAIGNFDCLIAPIYGRREGATLVMGFRCAARHTNAHGTCHGGMIASFADVLAYATRVEAGLFATSVPTVTLSVDYLRPVREGDWVEGRTELLKQGARLIFARILGTVDGVPVFSATSINVPGADDPRGAVVLATIMATEPPQSPQ